MQRDVRELSRIHALDALPKLVMLVAGQSAHLLNAAELAGPLQLSGPTVRDHLTLLERVFVVDVLAPRHHNRLSPLIKTPKVHAGDTGVACAVLGLDAAALLDDRAMLGAMLETCVFQELRRQASWRGSPLPSLTSATRTPMRWIS